jgi:hypothetical protein
VRDTIKGIDQIGMVLCRECERSTVGVKFRDEHTAGVSRQFHAGVSSKVVILKHWHRKFLSLCVRLAGSPDADIPGNESLSVCFGKT